MITLNGFRQLGWLLLILICCIKPLGWYMARVYEGKPCGLNTWFGFLERFIYRVCGISPSDEMDWKRYLAAMLVFNFLGMMMVYGIERLQVYLPLNPQLFPSVTPDLAFNTAASYVTNTNWQAYGGETTMSYLTQMMGLTLQNFLSAATGMALLIAFIRGLVRRETNVLGNYWVDMVRGTLYILIPLAFVLAIALVSQGVIQNFKAYEKIQLVQPMTYQDTRTQIIPMGPVASQVAIKQLGTNGGGFFNANSAHPYENPTPLSNFLEMLAILLIPASLCYTFGMMVKDTRQGIALLMTMFLMFIPPLYASIYVEQQGNPALREMGVDLEQHKHLSPGGNMEGKETRFGIVDSAMWAASTTATSNGSVNSMHDSYMPYGGLAMLWFMHLGEVIFGGVGSGLYGMLTLALIAVFVAGLMVGRTPEYLGKKIEPFEMKMAVVAVLIMPLSVLLLTAFAVVNPVGIDALGNPGAHGFTEILYAFTSFSNNNGSAFAGLKTNTLFYNVVGGVAMLCLRYWIAIPVLAMAGSLARKKIIPASLGTLPTHNLLFIFLLMGVAYIIGALSFFPALSLGPIVEHHMLWRLYG